MSASEKLKELHPLLTGPPARKFRDGAWDEIIAVVEAAERYGFAQEVHVWGAEGEHAFPDLANALVALDEALQ